MKQLPECVLCGGISIGGFPARGEGYLLAALCERCSTLVHHRLATVG